MKIKSNTLLLIVGILFVMVCGLSYFFYSKHKSTMKYINNQFQTYNHNLQNQMVAFMDQYKNFMNQNKPVIKTEEEEQQINDFIADLEKVDEDDLELEKEIQIVKEEQENKKDLDDIVENLVKETEIKALLTTENRLPMIKEEDLAEIIQDLIPVVDVEDITEEDETPDELFEDDLLEESDDELPTVEDSDIEESEDEEVEEESDSEVESEDEEVVEDLEMSDNDEIEIDFSTLEDSDDDAEFEVTIPEVSIDATETQFIMSSPSPEPEIEEKELEPRCSFVMKRGKNKGNCCERKATQDGRCKKHIGK